MSAGLPPHITVPNNFLAACMAMVLAILHKQLPPAACHAQALPVLLLL